MHLVLDLGTAWFRAGLLDKGQIIREPCTVARDKSGRVIVGEAAEQMVGRNPEIIDVVRPLEAGMVKDADATVEIVRYASRKFASRGFARKFSITVAVPSGVTPVERRALEEVVRQAGAKDVRFCESTVAAAIGADLPISEPIGCIVVNLGAGVTEVAVLSMGGIVDSRRLNTGGRTVDENIVEGVRKDFSFVIGQKSAEVLKQQLGDAGDQETLVVRGRNLSTGLPDKLEVPLDVVREPLNAYYKQVVELIVQALETCPPELVGDIMERGIVLVGGGANVQGVLTELTQLTSVPIIVADQPQDAVIEGLMKLQSTGLSRGMGGQNSTFRNLFSSGSNEPRRASKKS